MRCAFFALLLANVAAVVRAGPTLDEWKEGQASASADADAVTAKDAKMSAVGKVLKMLTDVQDKVAAEGEAEAKTYDEFACFCKTTIDEKGAAIKSGEDDKATLEAAIETGANQRDTLDDSIEDLVKLLEDDAKAVAEEKELRAKQLAAYKAESADVEAGLVALAGAIKELKASKRPVLLQLQGVANTVRTAALIADSLGLVSGKSTGPLAAFLQEDPQVPFEDYKFKSNDIISMLEELEKSFKQTKISLDEVETKSVHDSTLLLQNLAAKIKDQNADLEADKGKKADTIAKLNSDSEQLSTTAAQLLDDKQYLDKLAEMCTDKKKTWDQRFRARSDELHTLTEVIGIVSGEVSDKTRAATVRFGQVGMSLRRARAIAVNKNDMEAVEAAAEAAEDGQPASLLQQLSVKSHNPTDGARDRVISMLRSKSQQLKSESLAALVTQLSAVQGEDPFAKIKVLIQELIERLLQEAANEANQKGWCDKATSAATQKRDYAAEEVMNLNAEMAQLEALLDKLEGELKVLATEIDELTASRKEAEELRAKESDQNNFTVTEATAGLKAINLAMETLDKWYKTNAKNVVSMSQQSQSPEDDAPDAGFDNFEAYTGAQGENTGIIGMMEVIASDFSRTITETEKQEAAAEEEHLAFMTETGKSLGEKTSIETQKTSEKDSAVEDLSTADDKLTSNNDILLTSIKELLELKAACVDTGMSYDERVANREDEIESLKKALCILGAYQKYGPDGVDDAC